MRIWAGWSTWVSFDSAIPNIDPVSNPQKASDQNFWHAGFMFLFPIPYYLIRQTMLTPFLFWAIPYNRFESQESKILLLALLDFFWKYIFFFWTKTSSIHSPPPAPHFPSLCYVPLHALTVVETCSLVFFGNRSIFFRRRIITTSDRSSLVGIRWGAIIMSCIHKSIWTPAVRPLSAPAGWCVSYIGLRPLGLLSALAGCILLCVLHWPPLGLISSRLFVVVS